MTAINQAYNRPLDMAAKTALNVEPLEKVAKIGNKTIELTATFTAVSASFAALSEHLKGTATFFETVQFFGRVKELICLDKNGKSFFQVNTWQKSVDRVTLAIHSSMKAIRTLAKHGMVNLGRLSANIAGKLSIFSFATDAFILTSCVFSIWDNVKKIPKVRKDLAQAGLKIEKWQYRKTLIAQVESGIQSEIDTLKAKYEKKAAAVADKAQQAVDEVGQTLQKYAHRLALIEAHDHQGLADELAKTDTSDKMKKWTVIQGNATLARNKLAFGITNSAMKIGVVSLALILTATNVWANIVLRPLLLGGIATDSVGLTKFFYDHYNKPTPVPQKPVAPTAAMV